MADTKIIIGGTTTVIILPQSLQGVPGPTGNTGLDGLPYYDSDGEAIDDGLAVGDFYKIRTTGTNDYGLKRGQIVEVEAV